MSWWQKDHSTSRTATPLTASSGSHPCSFNPHDPPIALRVCLWTPVLQRSLPKSRGLTVRNAAPAVTSHQCVSSAVARQAPCSFHCSDRVLPKTKIALSTNPTTGIPPIVSNTVESLLSHLRLSTSTCCCLRLSFVHNFLLSTVILFH